ncbi:hypothetical protein ACFQY7_35090 [Actinomadura luteofluorescens]|uniref:hypothetical protein n=1 Tax=Actinomadura luteofluorescens TaxID=46163 RepID=UPI003645766A
MTVEEAGPEAAEAADPDPDDLYAAAGALVADLVHHPWGRSSPSVYETGRLVSLAPWLTGHSGRIRFLLDTQRPDGGWGAPDPGYALVPTLSATEALLSALASEGAAGLAASTSPKWSAAPGARCGPSPGGSTARRRPASRTCRPSSTSPRP